MFTIPGTAEEPEVALLNDPTRDRRLKAAARVGEAIRAGRLSRSETEEINNHVHTIYSFSPYAPSMAAYLAWRAGLKTVGAMDHDSVDGCEEMLLAAERIGIASTVGFELRVTMSDTRMAGRKLNNPDSPNIAYIAVHGIPRRSISRAAEFLSPVREARNLRNRRMVESLSELIEPWGLPPIDFHTRVVERSMNADGGSITERHILFALAELVVDRFGRGAGTIDFLEQKTGLTIPDRVRAYLSDLDNPHYLYDLLGVFKGSLIREIYIQPDEHECPPVADALACADSIGAIPAYAYLGDVTDSPTGDKQAARFEDSFLEELAAELKRLGFKAITYMPPRNTREQLMRLQALCREHGFMEISGVDINSSRQSFNCPVVVEPDFVHLTRAAWALIAHEKLADKDERMGLFHPDNPLSGLALSDRIDRYAEAGRAMDPHRIESIYEYDLTH